MPFLLKLLKYSQEMFIQKMFNLDYHFLVAHLPFKGWRCFAKGGDLRGNAWGSHCLPFLFFLLLLRHFLAPISLEVYIHRIYIYIYEQSVSTHLYIYMAMCEYVFVKCIDSMINPMNNSFFEARLWDLELPAYWNYSSKQSILIPPRHHCKPCVFF